jgi:hypothetical protein
MKKVSSRLYLFTYPEDGGDVFLLNVGLLSTGYTELYARRQMSSQPTV